MRGLLLSHRFQSNPRHHFAASSTTQDSGFTIVELLIVIVVIGILAAISIVAYNGITARGNAASAQSAASQAAQKVTTYMVLNADQVPADLSIAGVSASGSTSYQYTSNSSASPQSFCMSATTATKTYFVNNTTQTTPSSGSCPITNLVLNPSFENDANGWSTGGSATGLRWASQVNSGAWSFQLVHTNGASAGNAFAAYQLGGLTIGSKYTFSSWMRATGSGSPGLNIVVNSNSIGGQTPTGWTNIGMSGLTGTYQRFSGTFTADSNTVWLIWDMVGNGQGESLDLDGIMLYQGTSATTSYLDGASPGWIWNGTANSSTSNGPAS